MNKIAKSALLGIVMGIIAVGGYYLFQSIRGAASEAGEGDYEWTTMDEYYAPRDLVEDFILKDAAAKDILPVSIRNYGNDKSVLKRFRGSRFAGPTEAQLKMMFKGLEDWKLVDIKYVNEKDREIQRTVLYVSLHGEWRVGDSGKLVQ